MVHPPDRRPQNRKARRLAALAWFLVCAGCLPANAPREDRIVVWAWPGALQGLESGYEAFKERYPDIDVEFVEIPWAGGGLPTKLQIALMARSGAPDVTGLMSYHAPAFVSYRAMYDVSDRLAGEVENFPAYKIQECTDGDGRLRAVPWDIGPVGLFYRHDIFEQYGETVPENWKAFLVLGERMAKRGHYMLNLSNVFSGPTAELYEYLLAQQGQSYFSDSGDVTINCPEAVRAFSLMMQMRDRGICIDAGSGAAEWGLFKSGALLCRARGAYDANIIPDYVGDKPEDGFGGWRVALLPAFEPGGARASIAVSSVLAIPGQSTRKEAAWKYVHFMTATVEGARTQTEYGGLAAYLPSLKIPEILNYEHPFFGGQQINRLFLELNNEVPKGFSYPPCFEEARRILRSELEPVWRGEGRIEEALARTKTRIERVLEEYQ